MGGMETYLFHFCYFAINDEWFCFSFTGTDDEQHDYDYLNVWGPRFDKLADMYGHDQETDLEDEDDEELQWNL